MTTLKRTLLALLLMASASLAGAQERTAPAAAAPEASPADAAWQALQAIPQRPPRETPEAEAAVWERENGGRYESAALAFYLAFPDDPRRWRPVISYVMRMIRSDNATPAEKALAYRLFDDLQAAQDAEVSLKRQAAFSLTRHRLSPRGNPAILEADLDEVAKLVDDYRKHFENLPPLELSRNWASFVEEDYVELLMQRDPDRAEARLRTAVTDSNPDIAKMAAGQLQELEAMKRPMQMKFTALDGREVDLGKLRGKVVLVDFWATWCVPCVKELPNVQRVYDAYHDKGFEVIGISLDRASARETLIKFIDERKLPWPQHYDGKHWDNEISSRFGIRSIPTMYVLDKQGLLVTSDASGPRLEEVVKQLLSAPASR